MASTSGTSSSLEEPQRENLPLSPLPPISVSPLLYVNPASLNLPHALPPPLSHITSLTHHQQQQVNLNLAQKPRPSKGFTILKVIILLLLLFITTVPVFRLMNALVLLVTVNASLPEDVLTSPEASHHHLVITVVMINLSLAFILTGFISWAVYKEKFRLLVCYTVLQFVNSVFKVLGKVYEPAYEGNEPYVEDTEMVKFITYSLCFFEFALVLLYTVLVKMRQREFKFLTNNL